MTIELLIAYVSLGFSLVVFWGVITVYKRLNKTLIAQQKQIESAHIENQAIKEQITQKQRQLSLLTEQFQKVSSDLDTLREVTHLQQELSEQLQNKIQLLEANAQKNPLYERAKKMLQLGADIEEVMTECELSRTEAELILSLNNK